MREFAADPETSVHPQTVIEHFGSWNAAKRAAGLVPRRFATREELLGLLRELGERARPAADRARHRRAQGPHAVEVALLAHVRLALDGAQARRASTSPVGEERLERAVDQGVALAEQLGRLPKFADWAAARKRGRRRS